MKKSIMGLLLATMSLSASASCYQDYQDTLVVVNDKIANSNIKQARYEGMAIAGGLGLSTTTTATGGSAAVSTTVSAKLVAALYAGQLWMNMRISDETENLVEDSEKLGAAIAILKEARVGNGPFLQGTMAKVWNDVSPEVSLSQVAAKVVELDDQRAFCQSEAIATPAGILAQTIEGLKR